MSGNSELAERVFAPGNLVFGGPLKHLDSFQAQGIRPSIALGIEAPFTAPSNICFAMLSDKPFPTRYTKAKHFAPAGFHGGYSLGIVVSREGLLASIPNQVFAIGEYFWGHGNGDKRKRYNYNSRKKTVFDIPVRIPETDLTFSDEVRVYPEDVQTIAVKPEIWKGIVMEEFYFRQLSFFLKDPEQAYDIPVFSDKLTLLTESLRQTALSLR